MLALPPPRSPPGLPLPIWTPTPTLGSKAAGPGWAAVTKAITNSLLSSASAEADLLGASSLPVPAPGEVGGAMEGGAFRERQRIHRPRRKVSGWRTSETRQRAGLPLDIKIDKKQRKDEDKYILGLQQPQLVLACDDLVSSRLHLPSVASWASCLDRPQAPHNLLHPVQLYHLPSAPTLSPPRPHVPEPQLALGSFFTLLLSPTLPLKFTLPGQLVPAASES